MPSSWVTRDRSLKRNSDDQLKVVWSFMGTLFDVITVTCFFAIVLAYFQFAAHDLRTVLNLLVSGVAFAVANQAGNAGYTVIATLLIVLGLGFAFVVIRQKMQH